jgi:hypothetical protein
MLLEGTRSVCSVSSEEVNEWSRTGPMMQPITFWNSTSQEKTGYEWILIQNNYHWLWMACYWNNREARVNTLKMLGASPDSWKICRSWHLCKSWSCCEEYVFKPGPAESIGMCLTEDGFAVWERFEHAELWPNSGKFRQNKLGKAQKVNGKETGNGLWSLTFLGIHFGVSNGVVATCLRWSAISLKFSSISLSRREPQAKRKLPPNGA